MPMMRKNPIPPGRYWIFIQKTSLDIFELWLQKSADSVTVEKREDYGAMGGLLKPDESFFIFTVKAPTIWPRGVGFANVAEPVVTKSDDVKIRGPVPTAKDVIKDIAETAAEAASGFTTTLIILGALWFFTKDRK